jgi:hypothetical protein
VAKGKIFALWATTSKLSRAEFSVNVVGLTLRNSKRYNRPLATDCNAGFV